MIIVSKVCRFVVDFRLQTRRPRVWGSGTGRPTSRTLTSVLNLSWTMAKTKPVSKWPFFRQNIYLAFYEILCVVVHLFVVTLSPTTESTSRPLVLTWEQRAVWWGGVGLSWISDACPSLPYCHWTSSRRGGMPRGRQAHCHLTSICRSAGMPRARQAPTKVPASKTR